MNFYICRHCGNIITKLTDSKVPVMCCGEKMELLEAGVTDAAVEKHVPAVSVDGSTVNVQVGSTEHPMIDTHWIEWITVETSKGFATKWLNPGDAPKASFVLAEGEELKAVYAYCNLHGLWKA
ncbi:MAG TPA: desulfoferrodoxin [Candidatus Eisenbergiella merdavium]|uniref:Desulfoferrodoxin n=1 Tax=Candidatus Eisenbergiella merdavium TaxID=2838551 RepID=A0A9D2NGI1_9FIRM|nr:desulfoferrodoxin [Candidatus Eisenbergiella merdavium]